jgi:hypothetical protein
LDWLNLEPELYYPEPELCCLAQELSELDWLNLEPELYYPEPELCCLAQELSELDWLSQEPELCPLELYCQEPE